MSSRPDLTPILCVYQSPTGYSRKITEKVVSRLMSGTRLPEDGDGCWVWTRALTKKGYGQIAVGRKMIYVHRIAYLIHNGKLDPFLQVDHTCRNPKCVNPSHLTQVTNKVNKENVSGPRKDNLTSGLLGVSWSKTAKKWRVQVTHNGTWHNGGFFESISEAELAAKALRTGLFSNNLVDRLGSHT